jgi:hypothetical protein
MSARSDAISPKSVAISAAAAAAPTAAAAAAAIAPLITLERICKLQGGVWRPFDAAAVCDGVSPADFVQHEGNNQQQAITAR